MPDDLASAALDLARLPRADRAAILAALSQAERRDGDAARRGQPRPAQGEAPLHSGWFEGLVIADHVLPAARAALVAASRTEQPVDQRPGRSLMQAASGLFAQAGARR